MKQASVAIFNDILGEGIVIRDVVHRGLSKADSDTADRCFLDTFSVHLALDDLIYLFQTLRSFFHLGLKGTFIGT